MGDEKLKKVIFCILVIMTFLCGCNNSKTKTLKINKPYDVSNAHLVTHSNMQYANSFAYKDFSNPSSSIILKVGHKNTKVESYSYWWKHTSEDSPEIYEIISDLTPIELEKNETVKICFNDDRKIISAKHWKLSSIINKQNAVEDKIQSNSIKLPSFPDIYAFEICIKWINSLVYEYFLVRTK
jgi:hypothetical protein